MKKTSLFALGTVALLSLAACEQKPEEVSSTAPDPMASALKNAPPVVLPPSISASKSFRCQPGNTLLFADFYKGDTIVKIATEKDAPKTELVAPAAGEPYVAEGGYSLTGNDKAVTVTIPGVGTKTCKS